MATIREHLRKAHESMAQHHRAMSKCHSAAMSKETMGADQKEFHKAAAAAHDQAADAHDAMCEACLKAATDDLSKLVPTMISAVTPDIPPGVRAVPRAGQRPIPERPDVPLEFQKIVGLDELDQL